MVSRARRPDRSVPRTVEPRARPIAARPGVHAPDPAAAGARRLAVALLAAGNDAAAQALGTRRPHAAVQRRDLHAGAAVPDTAGQQAITGAMNPTATISSTGAVTMRTWAGRQGGGGLTPATTAARAATLADLRSAVFTELDAMLPDLRTWQSDYTTNRMSPADIEGAGNAAADVVRGHVGGYIRHSSGGATRSQHGFTAGGNLLDAYDPTDRATAGEPVSAEAVVWWAVLNSPCAAARRTHAFDPNATEEGAWLQATAVPAIANARRADLELWDQFGFAMVGRLGGRTLATTVPPSGFSTTAPSGGGLSPSQRAGRWSAYTQLMHEFFHLVEHPTHQQARRSSPLESALNEGVTDALTEDVYNATVASVRTDAAIITRVEGSAPAPGTSVPTTMLPAAYAIAYPSEVAEVRAALGTVSLDGFKAAYLSGHVEYEGLTPSGAYLPPVAAGTGQGIDLPPDVRTLGQLSHLSGVPVADIVAANPDHSGWPLPPARANVPGWREHVVVATPGGTVETLTQIAKQRGVSEADLAWHNDHLPGWPTLTAGMKLLVPPQGFRR